MLEKLRGPVGAYDALVVNEDGKAVAYDRNGNVIAGPSTDHASVIQETIDYFVNGVKIIVSGYFELSSQLNIIDKQGIILDLRNARMKVVGGDILPGDSVIRINRSKNIKILGGEIDVDSYNRGVTGDSGITLFGDSTGFTTGIEIVDIKVINAEFSGVLIRDYVKNVFIRDIELYDCRWGITSLITPNSENINIDGVIHVVERVGINQRYAVNIDRETKNVNIKNIIGINIGALGLASAMNINASNLISINAPVFGINIETTSGYSQLENINISDVYIEGAQSHCIEINTAKKVTIKGFTVKQCGVSGIDIFDSDEVKIIDGVSELNNRYGIIIWMSAKTPRRIDIENVTARNNSQELAGAYDGIRIGAAAEEVSIINCRAYDDQTTPTQSYGIYIAGQDKKYKVMMNTVYGNINGQISFTAGKPVLLKSNVGFVTENSGTVVLSGDGVASDFLLGGHGLSPGISDPGGVIVRCTPASPDAIAASPITCYLSDEDGDGVYESIRAKFTTAPPAGTNNIKITWTAEYIG